MNLPFNDEQKMNEIIFARRNKNYGAYAIRASYNASVLRSLIIVSSSVFLFAALAYVFADKREEIKHFIDSNQPDSFRVVEFKSEEKIPDPAESKPGSAPPSGRENSQSTTIVDTLQNSNPDPTNDELASTGHSDSSSTGVSIPGGSAGGGNAGDGIATFSISAPPTETFAVVDENPEFEGGVDALRKFISDNTVYPTLARDIGVEGTVYVSFVVDERGKVGAIRVLRGVAGGCTEEAVRVVGKIPDFKKPGKMGNVAVKSWYNIPIKFKLR